MDEKTLKRRHNAIHKILYLIEDVEDGSVRLSEFRAYLDRTYVKFLGVNDGIASTIRGLIKLPDAELTKAIVRSVVFDMHDMLDKEERNAV